VKARSFILLWTFLLPSPLTLPSARSAGEVEPIAPTQVRETPQTAAPGATATAVLPVAPERFLLEDGTPVKLELTRDLSSADATVGERVDFQVLEDVKINDRLVIPMGGIAWADLTEVKHKRSAGRGGKLNLVMDTVRLADGQKVRLRTIKKVKGAGHTDVMAAGMLTTGIFLFPVAPLFLFIRGEEITIPAGTHITAYTHREVPLDRERFATETPEGEAARKAEAEAQIKKRTARYMMDFKISSTPDNAEIRVDGELMGKTPRTLWLHLGKHKFQMDLPGYKPWEDVFDVGEKTTTSVTVLLSIKKK
jgi:PEGA domain